MGERRLDTRPSDAIALAMRLNAPLFVSEDVLDAAGTLPIVELDDDEIDAEVDEFRGFLAELDPADFISELPATGRSEPPRPWRDRRGEPGGLTPRWIASPFPPRTGTDSTTGVSSATSVPVRASCATGSAGVCFVRAREGDGVVLTTYGRSSGFCVDPIEKKPLNHFLPGSAVFSFGTAGCNLACRFCQNWDISKSKEIDTLADEASPETIARTAVEARMPQCCVHVQRSDDLHGVRDRRRRCLPRGRCRNGGGDGRLHVSRSREPSSTVISTPPTST